MHVAKVYVNKKELEYWDGLLHDVEVDLEKEKLARKARVFLKSVEFDDGFTGEIRIVTDRGFVGAGTIIAEMLVYGLDGGLELIGEPRNCLSGEFLVDNYKVVVCENPFEALETDRSDFVETVMCELLNGVTDDYAGNIADAIADDVADDVVECADHNEWNDCDVRLAIGRVLLKALGVSE